MSKRDFVYASSKLKGDRWVVRLTTDYRVSEGWSDPRIVFVAAQEDDPDAVAIREYENPQDGGLTYAPDRRGPTGWEPRAVAFHAYAGAGPGRVRVAPIALETPKGSIYLIGPPDAVARFRSVREFDRAEFFVGTVDRSRWMEETPAIHGKKLRHICLPCSHDAATSVLQDIKTDDNGEDLAGFLNTLREIGEAIAATGIGIIIDVPLWLSDNLFGLVKGLGRTQSQSVGDQLKGGIRGLDLRVYYYAKDDTFYTYHGALGQKLEIVLDELQTFLSSRPGEIVYVTFTHSRHLDSQAIKDRLTAMIRSKVGSYAYRRTGTNDDTLFDQTYADIVAQGVVSSKVILVYGEDTAAEFWPIVYSGQGSTSVIAGLYSDSSDIEEMLAGQVQNYQQAVAKDLPFSLFMTLTPQESDVYARAAAAVAGPLAVAALGLLLIPFVGWALFPAAEALAAALAIYGETLPWRTQEELSALLSPTLVKKVEDNFVPASGPNLVTLAWVNFYERSGIVDLAIRLSQR